VSKRKRKQNQQPSSERVQQPWRDWPARATQRFPRIQPYVVAWGSVHSPNVEFFSDPVKVNERLNHLWDIGKANAQARLTTWTDIVFSQQARIK
jgi:hypothetical protein